jgi:hypothetical protein
MSLHQNAGQSHNFKGSNKFSENVAKSKYVGTAVTNQNYIHGEIKSRLNLENASYHSVQNLLFSHLSFCMM